MMVVYGHKAFRYSGAPEIEAEIGRRMSGRKMNSDGFWTNKASKTRVRSQLSQLRAIEANGGASVRMISYKVDKSEEAVRYDLARMVKAGLIVFVQGVDERSGRLANIAHLTDKGAALIGGKVLEATIEKPSIVVTQLEKKDERKKKALEVISYNGQISVIDLANLVGTGKTSMQEYALEFIADGLVTETRVGSKGQRHLEITDKGRESLGL
jgi:predicted ArsR family transcriptional regulator